MTRKTVARHGDWKSPISLEMVTGKTRKFNSPRVSRPTGRAFYTETRDNGEMTIIEVLQDGVKDILPKEYAAQNTMYNYGCATLDALPDGRVIFSNKDEAVKILDPDTGDVAHVTGNPVLRYSDFNVNDANPWVLALEEDHTHDTPLETVNRIVAINTDDGSVRRIVQGSDFYYSPQFSHDGTKMAWLEWDHPDMAWFGARLLWAEFTKDGWAGERHLVAGGLLDGVAEPRWGPDGTLFFGREKDNYRQLFRLRPGDKSAAQVTGAGLELAEFGELTLMSGSHTYAPLSDKLLVAAANFNGTGRLVGINLETGDWAQIAEEEEVIELVFDRVIGLSATSVLGIFAGTKRTSTVRIFDVADASRNRIVRNSIRYDFPESFISFPEALAFPAQGEPKRTVHGFLWMPRNPEYTAEEGVLPPLVVYTHGGPTGTFSAGLNPRVQYLTSRGYAVFYLNYHGSTAHGRAHRDALWGRWGLLDADDTAEAARHLVASGRVRPGAVGCTGLSAGGYNTLMTVARHPDAFAGAVDVSGICDVASWRTATHKLEWFYADRLVMDKTAATPDDMAARYRERSALPRVDAVTTPLLIIHGKLDTVVALNQATDMADALEERGRDVRLVKVDNDGHMLAKPPSMRIWLDEEEKWWRKTLIGV